MVKTQKTKKSIPPCVKWLNFLNEALEADRVKIISLQKFFGYCVSDQITSSLMDSINPLTQQIINHAWQTAGINIEKREENENEPTTR
ncbi:MAG TPA: hypothetical protein P5183_11850 [Smithellaceae bacterium]|nr:hypothetical protein [Smithellaceae bacterium]